MHHQDCSGVKMLFSLGLFTTGWHDCQSALRKKTVLRLRKRSNTTWGKMCKDGY